MRTQIGPSGNSSLLRLLFVTMMPFSASQEPVGSQKPWLRIHSGNTLREVSLGEKYLLLYKCEVIKIYQVVAFDYSAESNPIILVKNTYNYMHYIEIHRYEMYVSVCVYIV